MHPSSTGFSTLLILLRGLRHWGFLVAGLGPLLVAIALLLGADFPTAAGLRTEVAGEKRAPASPERERQPPSDVGAVLAQIDPSDLYYGLGRLARDLRPTPTPTPTPSPTPTPTPSPAPQPAAPTQATSPQRGAPAPTATSLQSAPPASASCPTASMSGPALALFDSINRERLQRGLAALAADACLTGIARHRSEDMAARHYFAHSSPEGETSQGLLRGYAVPFDWFAENLAMNDYPAGQSVQIVIRDLMASAPHRANVLGPNYSRLGVGEATDGAGMKYYTMLFIGLD